MASRAGTTRSTRSRGSPELRLRWIMIGAGASSAIGVLVSGTVSRDFGAALLLAGWGAFVYALHRFGRLGD